MRTVKFKTLAKKFPLLKKRLQAVHSRLLEANACSSNSYDFNDYLEELEFYTDGANTYVENYDETLAFRWDNVHNRLRPLNWQKWDEKVLK